MGTALESITVILRGDAQCPTGKIQRVIQLCQEIGFVEFKLRVAQSSDTLSAGD